MQDSMPQIGELQLYVDCLYTREDWVENRLLPSRKQSWHRAGDIPSQFSRLSRRNQDQQNVYVGLNPRKAKGDSTAAGIALARVLFADFDGVELNEVQRRIKAANLPQPTLTLNSGHGHHAFWRLAEPITDLAAWSQLQRRLIAAVDSDKSIHDPPRLARLPGFLNCKEQPFVPCQIVEGDPKRVYELATLAAVLPEVAAEEKPAPAAVIEPSKNGSNGSLDLLSRAAKYISKIPACDVGARNSAAYRVAVALVNDFELPDGDAWSLMQTWNGGNTPPLPEDELQGTFKSAHSSAKKPKGNKKKDVPDPQLKISKKGKGKPAPPPKTTEELLEETPKEIKTDAELMLESPDLLKQVIDDVGKLGVAGERELIASIYLVGVSRLLPRPLAAIVQAPSSTGKSYVVEKTTCLFPDEAVVFATALTAQALYYLPPGALKHRFIVAGERSRLENDDSAEATRALREMIASGRLTKLVPMKEGNKIVTQTIVQEGPIAYVETTTLTKIFDEDANRCLLLSADERQAQTTAIVSRLAEGYSGTESFDQGSIVQKHHAAQRLLKQYRVLVPFASQIAASFDCERVEARRGFPHLMGMVQSSALLHQHQRQVDQAGNLVADVDDYRVAKQICQIPLSRLLGATISDAALRFYDRLVEWVDDKFTTAEARRRDRKSAQAVRGWLLELAEAGGVEQVAEHKGNKPAIWKLIDIDRKELEAGDCGLPQADDLLAAGFHKDAVFTEENSENALPQVPQPSDK